MQVTIAYNLNTYNKLSKMREEQVFNLFRKYFGIEEVEKIMAIHDVFKACHDIQFYSSCVPQITMSKQETIALTEYFYFINQEFPDRDSRY